MRRPRVRACEERFASRVLPLFKRKRTKVEEVVPELYLHGLALGAFERALQGLLVAERAFRRVRHPELMPKVSRGIKFVDGVEEKTRVAA